MVRVVHTILLLLAPLSCLAFGCFSDYSMSWCNNDTEESCVHDYTFSVSHFQRKLDDYYYKNARPPLTEAYFLTKTPPPYQEEFLTADCAPPLIMAYLLVAEARLIFDPNAQAIFDRALGMVGRISQDQAYLLSTTDTWPIKMAVERVPDSSFTTYSN